MDLQYDTEHNMLRDSAEKFLAERYGYRTFQKIAASEAGWSPEIWAEFAALGWLGLPLPAEDGGIGGGAVEVAILMECFGKTLVVEPYLPTVVLAGSAIALLGSPIQRSEFLGPVIEGRTRLALAHADEAAPTVAKKSSNGWTLTGAKKTVLGAPMADTILVSAEIGHGVGVFVVPAQSRGLGIRAYATVDGARAATIELSEVVLPASALLGANEDAAPALALVIDRAVAALSADAVGAMATMVAMTVDYTKTRVQFGQPIAKFQALQHRMVDMKVKEEEARASCLFATLSLEGSPAQRSRAVSGAKAKIGRNARSVAQNAIQLHGAIGTTRELPLGGYARRLIAYEALFGTTREHLRAYGRLIADPAVAADSLLAPAAT
jgi:alkylation response protein AidB-like acyl-CoA dehydrogenase